MCWKGNFATNVFGMKFDCKFPSTLLDFIRSFGAMNCLLSENENAELSSAVNHILCQFYITAHQSKPYYQSQNPVECHIQFVKSLVRVLMHHAGSPSFLWLLCTKHVCYALNHKAHVQLKGLTPIQHIIFIGTNSFESWGSRSFVSSFSKHFILKLISQIIN
jgi:hypothetical protein